MRADDWPGTHLSKINNQCYLLFFGGGTYSELKDSMSGIVLKCSVKRPYSEVKAQTIIVPFWSIK